VEQPEKWLFDTHIDDATEQVKSKRTIHELFVSAERRIELLRDDWGITERELAAAMHVVDEIKKSRQKVVVEFRRLLALKRQQEEQAAQASDASDVDFPITRLEC
jgi:predicted  nucleic acid-binding Zn-ribbon protein